MTALADLEAALPGGAGDGTLALAIAAWRETRANALADLVDRLAARCPPLTPPHARAALHDWWMAHALAYRAGDVASLVATVWTRCATGDVRWDAVRARWAGRPNPVIEAVGVPFSVGVPLVYTPSEPPVEPGYVANWIDRLAALVAWPDDPRLGPLLAEFLVRPGLYVRRDRMGPLREVIAARLMELGDRRIVANLAAYVREPRGAGAREREQQSELAARLVGALDAGARTPSPEDADAIARCAAFAEPAPSPRAADLDALWREVAERPDDTEPRLVLADVLAEVGDPRGELIVLQCRPPPATDTRAQGRATSRIHRLLRTEWERWFGDLALVLTRSRSEIRRGMLEVACIGLYSTPPWAWDRVRGHRELACVQTVRAGHVTPAHFAAFVEGLARPPREVELDAPEVVDELARRRNRWPFERVTVAWTSSTTPHRRDWPAMAATFEHLAQIAPEVATIDLAGMWSARFGAQVRDVIAHLPGLFDKLAAIRVAAATLANVPNDPDAVRRVRELPLVELY